MDTALGLRQLSYSLSAHSGVQPVLMHLTCHRPVADIKRILGRCRERGIRNILALRGDPPVGAASWRPGPGGLLHAQELVELIRREHGDYFCVAVAGYPEVHLESHNSPELPPSEQVSFLHDTPGSSSADVLRTHRDPLQARALDLERLRTKCAAGADFVVTQFCYDSRILLRFLEAARAAGVAVPIIPGYMPVQSYDGGWLCQWRAGDFDNRVLLLCLFSLQAFQSARGVCRLAGHLIFSHHSSPMLIAQVRHMVPRIRAANGPCRPGRHP